MSSNHEDALLVVGLCVAFVFFAFMLGFGRGHHGSKILPVESYTPAVR